MDVKEEQKTVFKGFVYSLPKGKGPTEIHVTESNVLKVMNDGDKTQVLLIPEGQPTKLFEEDNAIDKKTFQVKNEGNIF